MLSKKKKFVFKSKSSKDLTDDRNMANNSHFQRAVIKTSAKIRKLIGSAELQFLPNGFFVKRTYFPHSNISGKSMHIDITFKLKITKL